MISTTYNIKVGNEQYLVPSNPVNRHNGRLVIDLSSQIALCHAGSGAATHLFDIQIKQGPLTSHFYVKKDDLARALELKNCNELESLIQQSKLVQTIAKVTYLVQKLQEFTENTPFSKNWPIECERGIRGKEGERVIREIVDKFFEGECNDGYVATIQGLPCVAFIYRDQLEIVYSTACLGYGRTGAAFQVCSFFKKKIMVLKLATCEVSSQRERDAYHELYGTVPDVHFHGLPVNLYGRVKNLPLGVMQACAENGHSLEYDRGCKASALIMPFYNLRNLDSFPVTEGLHPSWRANAGYQLLIGICHLEARKKWHGDICSSNILAMDSEVPGLPHFKLIDLGAMSSFEIFPKRPLFCHKSTVRRSEETLANQCLQDKECFKRHIRFLAPKITSFSMAVCLFQLFLKVKKDDLNYSARRAFPYAIRDDSPDLSKPSSLWKNLKKIEPKISILLERIIFVRHYSMRLRPIKFLNLYHRIMEKEHTDLYKKYDEIVVNLVVPNMTT